MNPSPTLNLILNTIVQYKQNTNLMGKVGLRFSLVLWKRAMILSQLTFLLFCYFHSVVLILANEVNLLSYNIGDSPQVVEENYSCLLCFLSFRLNVYSSSHSYWKSTVICNYANIYYCHSSVLFVNLFLLLYSLA